MENLPEFLKGKKLLLIVGGLVLLLLVLMVVASGNRTKSDLDISQQGKLPGQEIQDIARTAPESQSPEVQRAIQEQMQVDQEYSAWQENNESQYPWLRKMPFTSDKYFFYYDLGKNAFVGKLYVNPEDDQDEIKEEIMNKLREEDIVVENFKFEWLVNP